MNIEKALSHFEWKLKNKWNPTTKDIEAYNSIIDFKDIQNSKNLQQNQTLAKLYCSILNQLLISTFRDSNQCNEILRELCQRDLIDHIEILKRTMEVEAIKRVGNDKYPYKDSDAYNMTKQRERTENILNDFSEELTKVMKTEIKLDQVIKFIESNINEIIRNEKTELV